MQVFISLGHNNAFNLINDHGRFRLSIYRDQGAGTGTDTEFRFSQKIAKELKKIWNLSGASLRIVPEKLNLQQRIAYINANSFNDDICIELHMDSAGPGVNGSSTWYVSGIKYAQDKAELFQKEYSKTTGVRTRGVYGDMSNRLGRLAFVRDTRPLALLLEMGFISNENDKNLVWRKAASGIYSAVQKIL